MLIHSLYYVYVYIKWTFSILFSEYQYSLGVFHLLLNNCLTKIKIKTLQSHIIHCNFSPKKLRTDTILALNLPVIIILMNFVLNSNFATLRRSERS